MNKCLKSSQSCQTGDYQIKIINRIPSPSDQIERETAKLFNTKLNNFLGYAFPLICCLGWVCILGAILSS